MMKEKMSLILLNPYQIFYEGFAYHIFFLSQTVIYLMVVFPNQTKKNTCHITKSAIFFNNVSRESTNSMLK